MFTELGDLVKQRRSQAHYVISDVTFRRLDLSGENYWMMTGVDL